MVRKPYALRQMALSGFSTLELEVEYGLSSMPTLTRRPRYDRLSTSHETPLTPSTRLLALTLALFNHRC